MSSQWNAKEDADSDDAILSVARRDESLPIAPGQAGAAGVGSGRRAGDRRTRAIAGWGDTAVGNQPGLYRRCPEEDSGWVDPVATIGHKGDTCACGRKAGCRIADGRRCADTSCSTGIHGRTSDFRRANPGSSTDVRCRANASNSAGRRSISLRRTDRLEQLRERHDSSLNHYSWL